jgi:regulator of RNase E activity RraA
VGDGDLVVLDATGAVRLLPEHADAVLDGARRYAAAEAAVAEALAGGQPLRAAYAHKSTVVAELRAQPAPRPLEPVAETRR